MSQNTQALLPVADSSHTSTTPGYNKPVIHKLWHWYQPPGQKQHWIDTISEQCYLPMSRVLAGSDPKEIGTVIVNINNILPERLNYGEKREVLDNLRKGAERGTVEFVGSGKYHPILSKLIQHPVYGKNEVERQIRLNDEGNREIFGDAWQRKGFFPPEMACSEELIEFLKELGFEWVVTEDSAYTSNNGGLIPGLEIATVKGLPVFFRSNYWSNEFTGKMPKKGDYDLEAYIERMANSLTGHVTDFSDRLSEFELLPKKFPYLLIGYDVETLGHHIPQYTAEKVYDMLVRANQKAEVTTPTRILDKYGKREVNIVHSSWSTNKEQAREGITLRLWDHPHNPTHKYMWELMFNAITVVNETEKLVEEYIKNTSWPKRALHNLVNIWEELNLKESWKEFTYIFLNYDKINRDIDSPVSEMPPAKQVKNGKIFTGWLTDYFDHARTRLDEGEHSCSQWWANPFDGYWSSKNIMRGATQLLGSAYSALKGGRKARKRLNKPEDTKPDPSHDLVNKIEQTIRNHEEANR
ncbi:MAG: hypothetical protein U9O94_00970 [Nanoarchaeota archaeon]|nr:hypothetical protein [Nanoarchaeota archaeon]